MPTAALDGAAQPGSGSETMYKGQRNPRHGPVQVKALSYPLEAPDEVRDAAALTQSGGSGAAGISDPWLHGGSNRQVSDRVEVLIQPVTKAYEIRPREHAKVSCDEVKGRGEAGCLEPVPELREGADGAVGCGPAD